MKHAKIEILEEGETTIFGNPSGQYFVREYKDDVEMSGSFYKTINEAEAHVREYQNEQKWSQSSSK